VNLGKRISSAVLLPAVLMGGLALAGCDDNVEVIRDPSIKLTHGMTWAWRPMNEPEPGVGPARRGAEGRPPVISRDVIQPEPAQSQHLESNRDWNTEANRAQLQAAIEKTMAAKGLTQVKDPAAADLLVDYHVAVRTHNATVERVYPGYPYGWGWGWGWGPPEVAFQNVRYRVGTFVLDIALRNPRKLAYRAISRKELNGRKLSPYQAEEAVKHLLKDLKVQ
jgi:Domain of unknown function (DUF4136)